MKEIKVGFQGTKKETIRYYGILAMMTLFASITAAVIIYPKIFDIPIMTILLLASVLVIAIGMTTFSSD